MIRSLIFAILPLFLCIGNSYAQDVYLVYDDIQEQQQSYEQEQDDSYLHVRMAQPLLGDEDPFGDISRYSFSAMRYSRRGYNYNQSVVRVGGIKLDDMLSSGVLWSVMRGLGDIPIAVNDNFGMDYRGMFSSSLGWSTEYVLNPDQMHNQRRVGYILTDRRFNHGVNLRYVQADSDRPWFVALSAAARVGNDSHITGVFRDDYRINMLLGRRLTDNQRLSMLITAAPLTEGLRSASVQEAFDLTGNNLYNPSWGLIEGDVRNSRLRKDCVPMALLNYQYGTLKFMLNASVSSLFGRTSTRHLSWYGASNPYPDYYGYLPSSFANSDLADMVEQGWREGDELFTQIDWARIYNSNRGDGISPSNYVLESDIRDIADVRSVVNASYLFDNITLYGGLNVEFECSDFYGRLDDPLQGGFVYDIDPFVSYNSDYSHLNANNADDKGRRVLSGDKLDYDYSVERRKYGANLGLKYFDKNYSVYADVDFSESHILRNGHYAKELYSRGVTIGRSSKINISEYKMLLGANLKLDAYSSVMIRMMTGTKSPLLRDMFADVRYSKMVMEDIHPYEYHNFEFTYKYSSQVKFLASVYATAMRNMSRIYRYYDDLRRGYMYAEYGDVNCNYIGLELSASVPLSEEFTASAAVALADNRYKGDMSGSVRSYLSGDYVARGEQSHTDNLAVAGSPQNIASFHISYSNRNLLRVDLGASFMSDSYVDINPMRRTDYALGFATVPEYRADLLSQQKLPAAFTMNLTVSKSFRIGDDYLSVFMVLDNLLNDKDIIYNGYEQYRLRSVGDGINSSWGAMPNKYYYCYGRTFYLSVGYRF